MISLRILPLVVPEMIVSPAKIAFVPIVIAANSSIVVVTPMKKKGQMTPLQSDSSSDGTTPLNKARLMNILN